MSLQPRRKLWSDSDCSFSLFAIMDKQTGSQSAGLVEGDAHSCGAVNIGAGSSRGERAGGKQASRPVQPGAGVSSDVSLERLFVYPARETQTFLRKSEVSSPEAGVEPESRLTPKHVPFTHSYPELSGQKSSVYSRSSP